MNINTLLDDIERIVLSGSFDCANINIAVNIISMLLAAVYIYICMNGHKIQRYIGIGIAFVFGAFLGTVLGTLVNNSLISLLSMFPLGILFSILSYKVPKFGNALIISFIPSIFIGMITNTFMGTIIFIVLFIVGFSLTNISITAILSLVSGTIASQLLLINIPSINNWVTVSILGAILAIVGFFLQCLKLAKEIREK